MSTFLIFQEGSLKAHPVQGTCAGDAMRNYLDQNEHNHLRKEGTIFHVWKANMAPVWVFVYHVKAPSKPTITRIN